MTAVQHKPVHVLLQQPSQHAGNCCLTIAVDRRAVLPEGAVLAMNFWHVASPDWWEVTASPDEAAASSPEEATAALTFLAPRLAALSAAAKEVLAEQLAERSLSYSRPVGRDLEVSAPPHSGTMHMLEFGLYIAEAGPQRVCTLRGIILPAVVVCKLEKGRLT